MKILLDLSKHCIQTAAKVSYEASLKEYFALSGEAADELEARIEGLRNFLEKTDFPFLRSQTQALCGGECGKATLEISGEDRFMVTVANQRISVKLRPKQ
jgi:hypothetical protein